MGTDVTVRTGWKINDGGDTDRDDRAQRLLFLRTTTYDTPPPDVPTRRARP